VAYLRNKLAVRTSLRNLNLKSQFSILDSFRETRVHTYDFFKFVGVKVVVANFFLGQSIGIDENTDRQTDRQTDMARSTLLVILIKNVQGGPRKICALKSV